MSHSFFNVASAVSAAAVGAMIPHQYHQQSLLLEHEVEVVEQTICEFAVTDSMVADIAFLDPADPDRINRAWQDRMYALCEERDQRLARTFTAWCLREETRASRLAESPRLPWDLPALRYPILEIHKNGQVHIYGQV